MYARVISVQGRPERLDDAISFLRDEVIPQARSMRGFRSGHWLVDRSSARIVGIAFWETMDDVEASAAAMARLREHGAQLLGGEVVAADVFEVVVEAARDDALAADDAAAEANSVSPGRDEYAGRG